MELEKVFDVTVEEDHSYAPVITTLTDRQKRIIKIRKRIKYCLKIINYLLLIGVGLTFVYPFVWMFVMSVRSYDESILFSGGLWVNEWHWENYVEAWNRAQFSKYLGNSITYAALVLGLQYFFIVPAAYAFARMEFKGKGFLFQLKQLGMMLPGEATLIPVYFFYSKLGLVDTWTGLVFVAFLHVRIYMFTNNFKTIPQDIIESALIDKAKTAKSCFELWSQ